MEREKDKIITIIQLSQLSFFGNKNHKKILMKKKRFIHKNFKSGYIPDIFIKGILEDKNKLKKRTEKRIENFFKKRFKVRDRDTLLRVYHDLMYKGTDTEEYWMMCQALKILSEENIDEILAADRYGDAKKYLLKNLNSIKNRFRAYDFANAVSILRLGFLYGYLERDETIDMLHQVYEETSRIYDTTEDFAIECCLAYEIERFIIMRDELELKTDRRKYIIREVLFSKYTGLLKH